MTEDEIHKIALVESSHWWYVGTRDVCFSLLRPHLAGRRHRILDIGCGTGGNLLVLNHFGDARGIDLDPLCVKYCRDKGLDAAQGSMLELAEPRESLDLVTMFDVLTQAGPRDTVRILSSIRNSLAPGGLVAFREPAMAVAAGAHDRAVNIQHRLTRASTEMYLRQAGFEPLRITYVNTLLFPPIVFARTLQERLNPGHAASDVAPASPVLNAALLAVLRVEKQLLRLTDMPFGVSIFAVARKPRME